MQLCEIKGLLAKKCQTKYVEGATSEEIKKFENENNVQLPYDYKEWLRMTDGGDIFLPGGFQFYGVTHKPLIDFDNKNKPNDTYVQIGAFCNGDPLLFRKGNQEILIY